MIVNNYFKKMFASGVTKYYDPGVMKLKRRHERVVRTCISMPPALFDYAHQVQRQEQFPTFSDFIQNMLRERVKMDEAKTQTA